MWFSSRLPLSSVIDLCRTCRHYLGSGLSLRDVFRQQAAKGRGPIRPAAARIAAELEKGSSLEDAMKHEDDVFPPLMLSLAAVGEQTGMLPEVFTELEKYYVRQQQLRGRFIALTAWPLFQFVAAVIVMTGLIYTLGQIPQETGPFALKFDPIGFGLSGSEGALLFLGAVFGFLLLLGVLYFATTRLLRGKGFMDAFLLRVPILGRCLRALALTRFCLALRLTLETGMPITRALKLSFRATDNAAFMAQVDRANTLVKGGEDLTAALTATGLFPEEFRHILSTAEESGRMTEVLRQEAEHYHEEAGRRMVVLTVMLSVMVWLTVAAFIIILIFRFFLAYIGLIDQLA